MKRINHRGSVTGKYRVDNEGQLLYGQVNHSAKLGLAMYAIMRFFKRQVFNYVDRAKTIAKAFNFGPVGGH